MRSLFFVLLLSGMVSLTSCEPEYRKDNLSVKEIETEIEKEYTPSKKKNAGQTLTKTRSEDDYIIYGRAKTSAQLESEAENEIIIQPGPPKKEEPSLFKKTTTISNEVYDPAKDLPQKNRPVVEEENSQPSSASGTVIAHAKRKYPPVSWIPSWLESYKELNPLQNFQQKWILGATSRWSFYQDLDGLCKRLGYDWVDVSLELEELPKSVEHWRNSEKKWAPVDSRGESWDYGHKWAYEEDSQLKFILVKSSDQWAFQESQSKVISAYCFVQFDIKETRVFVHQQNEVFERNNKVSATPNKALFFEKFFEIVEQKYPSKTTPTR